MRNTLCACLTASLMLIGCEAAPTLPEVEPQLSSHAGPDGGGTRTYSVTVYNLTSTQPLTPPLVATHNNGARLFRVGHVASEGVRQIAENGNLDPMLAALASNGDVSDVVVALSDPPPLLQNGSVSFEITADGGSQFLSWISMLICTNDGFAAERVRLPNHVGQSVTSYARSYDAGSEINTEDFADIVPPCQLFGATSSDDAGTGMSDPALAEGGRVLPHRGVMGGDDLDPILHGWSDPVAMVEIERIG